MTLSFEPSPLLLTFFAMQKLGFFALIAMLAGLRLAVGAGAARIPAGIAFAIALAGLAAAAAPAFALNTGAAYITVARWSAMLDGLMLSALASAIFLTCWAIPSCRWRWIDWLHLLGVIAAAGFWWWIMG